MALTKKRIKAGLLPMPSDKALPAFGAENRNTLSRGHSSDRGVYNLATALRFLPKGRSTVVELIQRAARNGDLSALRWWTVYADLREIDRQRVQLEDVCEASGVAPDEFMAIVVSTSMRMGADAADLIASVMHPRIVAQTARSAMRIGGVHAEIAQKDRQWMLENRKFIAGPRGTTVTVNANASAAAAAQPSVPTFLESVGPASKAHRSVQKAIEATEIVD